MSILKRIQSSLQSPVGIIHGGGCTVKAESKNVIRYVNKLRREITFPISIEVGYEAVPTGFELKKELEKAGIRCHVMAPTSIYHPAQK